MTNRETIRTRATPQQINAIAPGMGRRMISDEMVPNLYLSVEAGGTKTWRYDAAVPGGRGRGRIKMTLGRWPAYQLAEAREWARGLNEQRDRGDDPRALARVRAEEEAEADRQAEEQTRLLAETTVRKMYERWIAHKRLVNEAVKTLGEYERLAKKNLFDCWGDISITAFGKAEIRALLDGMRQRGSPGAANNMLAVLKTFLSWCVEIDMLEINPAASIKRTKAAAKNAGRHLSIPEMARLWLGAASMDANRRDLLRLLILTGARKQEAVFAHTDDLRDGVWTIPADRSKSGTPHHLPLGPLALEIFETRKAGYLFSDAPHPYLFNGLNEESRLAMQTIATSPTPHWTIHDIRAGVRTMLGSDEMDAFGEVFSENIGEILLNHSLGTLNRTYNQAKYTRQIRRALLTWEKLLMQEVARQEALRQRLAA